MTGSKFAQGFLKSAPTAPDELTLVRGGSASAGGETIMSDDSWSVEPFLGLVPHFHADPVEGVPLVSTDGHWWWDGYAWTPAPALAGAG